MVAFWWSVVYTLSILTPTGDRLLRSLASIKGYIEVLIVRYYYYISRRNIIKLEGYYLILRLDTSQDLRPNLFTRSYTLASFSLASLLGSVLYRIPIPYPLELLVEALDQLNLVEGFQGPSVVSLYRILGKPLQFLVVLGGTNSYILLESRRGLLFNSLAYSSGDQSSSTLL